MATPEFNPGSADGVRPFEVIVTCSTSGATIRFTTNGLDPDANSRPLPANGKVVIGTNLTLKAKAFKAGMAESAVKSADYLVTGKLSGGGTHALALRTHGHAVGWGNQSIGRLGNGVSSATNSLSCSNVQKEVAPGVGAALPQVQDISAGHASSAFVDANGNVWTTGDNVSGQLGTNSTADSAFVKRVVWNNVVYASAVESDFLTGMKGVSLGYNFGAAVGGPDNKVYTWGERSHGRLGDGYVSATSSLRKYAAPVTYGTGSDLTGAVQVSTGEGFGVALVVGSDPQGRGTLWAWGRNASGQLGQPGSGATTNLARATQVRASTSLTDFVNDVVDFDCASEHSVAIRQAVDSTRTVWCWGQQGNGRLGNGATATGTVAAPVKVQKVGGGDLMGIIQVSAASRFSLALGSDGKVWSWGHNADGQLGDGSTNQRAYADTVKTAAGVELTDIVAIGTGGHDIASPFPGFSLAVKRDGTIYGWGANSHGEAARQSATPANVLYATITGFSGFPLRLAPPTITLAVTNQSLYFPGAVTLTPTIGAGAGFDHIDYYRNGSLFQTVAATSAISAINLPVGTHSFLGVYTDSTGASASASHTVTIAPPTITLTAPASFTDEGSATLGRFRVARESNYGALNINYIVRGSSTATAGADYTALTGSVTIPHGQTSADITVGSLVDVLVEGEETVEIELATSANYMSGSQHATVTIVNVAPTTGRTVSVMKIADAREDGAGGGTSASGKFRFSRTGPGAFTATYTITGTATSGIDYTPLSGTVSFPATITIAEVSVDPLPDSLLETNETVTVTVIGDGVNYDAGSDPTATVSIRDAAPLPAIVFTPASSAKVAQQTVGIRAEGSEVVFYTLDGTTPTTGSAWLTAPAVLPVYSGLTIKAFGFAYERPTSPISSITIGNGIMQVAAGDSHSLLLEEDGTVWAWGSGGAGRLGLGAQANHLTRQQIPSFTGVKTVTAGFAHSGAVKTNGTVWMWGSNSSGQLGDNTTTDRLVPTQIPSFTNVKTISAGRGFTVALKNDGTVWTWGDHANGQLGNGSTIGVDSSIPVQASITNVTAIAAGGYHCLALKQDGTVWAWGRGWSGQLGDGNTLERVAPVQVFNLEEVVAISAGEEFSLALRRDGHIWGWGRNGNGQVSEDATIDNKLSPFPTLAFTESVAIAAGANHCLAIRKDGKVIAWGENARGATGSHSSFVFAGEVVGAANAAGISASRHSLMLSEAGVLSSWGANEAGQLGNGTTVDKNGLWTPTGSIDDSDGDGLSNYLEALIGSNPGSSDSNGDGISDRDAYGYGGDIDGDGVLEGDAYAYQFFPRVVSTDLDGDGISNAQEILAGTNPWSLDTDRDGVPDGSDAFPLDPTRSVTPPGNPSDTTPPIITITSPASGIIPL